jgi:signal transduction histidine kinase
MRDRFRVSTLRGQFLLIVIGGAVIPLGLVALWLTSAGVRSGEELLNHHLDQSGEQFAAAMHRRWDYREGYLLYLAGNDVTTSVMERGVVSPADSAFLDQATSQVEETIPFVELTDSGGRVLWSSSPATRLVASSRSSTTALPDTALSPSYSVSYPIPPDPGQARIGVLRATLAVSGMIPPDSARPIVPGARLGVRQSTTNQILVPLHPEVEFTQESRVTIGSETWLARTRSLKDAGLEMVLAAPLGPYVGPSLAAGRVGIIALILVGGVVLTLTVLLTTRVTKPLRELALAADAVSRGELEQQVTAGGPLEVRRVGGAFNVMTTSLRSTLEALSGHNAMVALGEFATALSHDVRNALTSIKVDVERTLHRPMDEARGSAVLQRALNNLARLDALVSGALRLARGKHMELVSIDLRGPVRAAAEIVAGAFAVVPATLTIDVPDAPVIASGDASALEQLLANVLFNAAQAVRPGGQAHVRLVRETQAVVIEITDDGIGMDEEQIAATLRPFRSSKSNGSGLGLPIARQIAAAHGGELVVASRKEVGTTVQLRLTSRVEP